MAKGLTGVRWLAWGCDNAWASRSAAMWVVVAARLGGKGLVATQEELGSLVEKQRRRERRKSWGGVGMDDGW